jgi:hypothetical protein
MTTKSVTGANAVHGTPDPAAWAAGYAQFLENGQVALDQWAKTSEAMAKGALDLSCEMARFSLDRLKEDLAVCETLRGCQSPSEAFDCNRRFAERATTQYLEYAGKLSGLLAQAARVAFPAPPQTARHEARKV